MNDEFAWAVCPYTKKPANECETVESAEHTAWHCEEMVRAGILERVGGADDPAEIRYRLKENTP